MEFDLNKALSDWASVEKSKQVTGVSGSTSQQAAMVNSTPVDTQVQNANPMQAMTGMSTTTKVMIGVGVLVALVAAKKLL